MLNLADRDEGRVPGLGMGDPAPSQKKGDVERLLAAMRRQLRLVIVTCILSVILGVGYVLTAVPQYTATAVLLLDNRRVRAVQDVYDVAPLGMDMLASAVDSQVEVLKSDSVVQTVIDRLQLLKDPEFARPVPGLDSLIISEIWKLVGLPAGEAEQPVDPEAARRRAADELRNNVLARRVPRTLVVEIMYRSPDPNKAATIANGFADAYLVDQLNAKYEATRRASEWLQNRLAELKQHALTSDLAVQRFRAQNDLVSSGGKLVNEQQLGEVNSQLVSARADTARAEARYERIRTIIRDRQTDAVVTEAIGNNVIEQLRTKFVNAAKREAELSARLGPNHGSVINLRSEMHEYERLMFEELSRIAEVYRSELDIARSREKSLSQSLTGLVDATAATNETLVALRELEREAESYKELYKTFLQRHQETVQQQSFPITEARVIMNALKPSRPSEPRKLRVLAFMFVLGGGLGICLTSLRELRDRGFRTGEQVREDLGLEFLGMVPYVHSGRDKNASPKKGTQKGTQQAAPPADAPQIRRLPSIMRYALDNPLSPFAETLRAGKIAVDLTLRNRSPKLIGIVSALPGEGKSTIAMNFAALLSHSGYRTLLIDGDLRNPGLTRAVAPFAEHGIVEAVLDNKPINELLVYEPDSALGVLPAVIQGRVPHTSEFLASPGMRGVLQQAVDANFTFVLLDLPPLAPVVDARAIMPLLDGVLLVVEWGKTTRALVRSALLSSGLGEKCVGVLLNKVALNKLKLYENYGPDGYYSGKNSKYYFPNKGKV
jgi:succinoglycan biosynthesis transport protein ExoP